MKPLFLIVMILFSSSALAQFSVQESDSSNRLKVLGHEWNTNFFSLASAETDKMNDEGGRISTYNYLTLATRLNDSYRFALRIPFQYNTAGTDRFGGHKVNEQEIFLQDIIVGLQNYELALLPWDMSVYWEGRVYLPTSKNSRQSSQIARARNEFIVSKVFSRYLEADYNQKVSYYVQSRSNYSNTFQDEYGFDHTVDSLTKQFELDHWLELWGKFAPQTGMGWQFGYRDTYWNHSQALNKSKPGEHRIKMGPEMRFSLSDNANFIFAYADEVNREHDMKEFGRFLAKNTSFTLLSFIRF